MSNQPLSGSYRQYFDSRFLAADDLPQGKEVKVTISSITREEVKGDGKRQDHPVIALHFEGKAKMMAVNKTNAALIRKATGFSDVGQWVGKTISITATTCNAFGDPNTPCIRVKAPRRFSDIEAAK